MPNTRQKARLSIDFTNDDWQVYHALKVTAAEQETTMREIVVAAVRDWLRRQENAEDLAAIAEAEAGDGEEMDWDQFKAELALPEEAAAVERAW